MIGPRVICAGCGEPTSLNKPICADCLGEWGPVVPIALCALCQKDFALDSGGLHYNNEGGYAGKRTAAELEIINE